MLSKPLKNNCNTAALSDIFPRLQELSNKVRGDTHMTSTLTGGGEGSSKNEMLSGVGRGG